VIKGFKDFLLRGNVIDLAVAVVLGAAFGLKLLADELDKAPTKVENQAPWAQDGAPQKPPKPLQ
jgi:large-conductance mechanosensitive channel